MGSDALKVIGPFRFISTHLNRDASSQSQTFLADRGLVRADRIRKDGRPDDLMLSVCQFRRDEMNHLAAIWGCILFLTFSSKHFPLLCVDCGSFIAHGYLTVEPAPLFLLGSNLSVYCHIHECSKWGSKMSLELRNKTVTIYDLSQRINCTTALLNVPSVLIPRSSAVCKMKTDQKSNWIVVNGLDLQAGLPPDKPANITCETTRSSQSIRCSWQRGRETHLPRSYKISIRENGKNLSQHIQDGEIIHILRTMLDENTKYQLSVEASNHFGASRSDPFILCVKDVVIPETPDIVAIEFRNISVKAVLRWKTPESAAHLRPHVRFRTNNRDFWVETKGEIKESLVIVDDLKPLTEYQFQMRVCDSASEHTTDDTPSFSVKPRCSRWSSSFKKTSPGKGPSQQLQVWRILEGDDKNSLRNITVLWKPPSPGDYNGEILHYKVLIKDFHEKICAAASNMCSVLVPEEVQALSISAVTPYGTSPPAEVEIRQSGVSGPSLQDLIPAADGSSVLVSWSSPTEGELLYYMIEWSSFPAADLQWKKLDKNQTNTLITGLTAGVRFNVSLYAATSRGISSPSSSLVYSREEKPTSGPIPYVLVHEARRLLIQWNELPIDQQRGFIINYTIYLQKQGSRGNQQSVTVSGSGPRQMWLDCPEGTLALQMTATNSAGEGLQGPRIWSQPAAPAVGLVVVIVFSAAIFFTAIANLMCCSCVRKRIKQKFLSWGPAWLVVNLPKPGHSNAIRLLKNDSSDPVLSSTNDSDPPLSPITVISQERDEVYPTIHVDLSQIGSGPCTSMSETGALLAEHAGYKPQIATLDPGEEEEIDEEEEQEDAAENPDKDPFSSSCGDLLSGLLSSVEVEYSDTFQGLTLGSIAGFLWPKSVETNILSSIFLQGKRTTADCVEADSASVDMRQDSDIRTSHIADMNLSWCAGEMKLDSGYFPQVTAVSGSQVTAEQQQKQRE
ncbi:interleukin-23 receptor isoform X4 [Oryzias melastigma]|uniref:interleukin-23 receptor isoform X4 n=1 Tax=Oryzias melastigma TaxID=30732 RepID=UPI00168CB330|nr:interleukin-23 receptor isoform X4 [Oryzias melastigma]